jgi:hypothetical protein
MTPTVRLPGKMRRHRQILPATTDAEGVGDRLRHAPIVGKSRKTMRRQNSLPYA